MIDKVDLRVFADAPYSAKFNALYTEIRNSPRGPFRQGRHYLASADLREYGYRVILHTHCIHGERGDHKLELVDTGAMTYAQMAREITDVFDVTPENLHVMRVDLAADVAGVQVAWFARNVLAQFKRCTSDFSQLDSEGLVVRMGKGGMETVYLGKRPNLFRIYNKVAELRKQFERDTRSLRRGAAGEFILPTFQEAFGYPEKGFILTRVERQFGGGRIPDAIGTFGALRNAAAFNPFGPLVFADVGKPDSNPSDYDLKTYALGRFVRDLVETQGIHRTKQFLNQHSKRNANRILKSVSDFLPSDGAMSKEILFDLYKRSLQNQLAA
jgi:hypothetical protein